LNSVVEYTIPALLSFFDCQVYTLRAFTNVKRGIAETGVRSGKTHTGLPLFKGRHFHISGQYEGER